jgi:hypothetical protein
MADETHWRRKDTFTPDIFKNRTDTVCKSDKGNFFFIVNISKVWNIHGNQ